VRAPEEAGVGTARVTYSFDDWPEGQVAPTTIELPVIQPPPADQKRDEKMPYENMP
jgi:hypothetical protein